MYDLIVIGGGPAGTSAAIAAASAGFHVLLLERGVFPRQKVCGEFVSAESLDLLSTLLDPAHKDLLEHAIRIGKTRVFLDGHTIQTAIDPPGASIARVDLDVALWLSAKNLGADAREKVTVQHISGNDPFQVSTSAGDFRSRAVINASGRWSNLTSEALSNNGSTTKWIGIKSHFLEPADSPSVDLYFFAGGYCGVQPVEVLGSAIKQGCERRINVCSMVRADVATILPNVFKKNPELEKRTRKWRELMEPVSTAPLIFRAPRPEQDGVLLVGDAAVFVDPFIGDGISLALRSGTFAAQALFPFLRRETSLDQSLCNYRKVYNDQLAPVFKASSVIRRMLKLPRVVRRPVLHLLRGIPALANVLVKTTR
jgi:flavin-dependent dehydrogenase